MVGQTNGDATVEQISKEVVAPTLGQVGEQYNPYDDGPEMRLFNVAFNPRHRNVQRGIFIDNDDPKGPLRYAWTNDQRSTWKVTATGDTLEVTEVHELEIPDHEGPVQDEHGYVREWMDVVMSELRSDVAGDTTRRSVQDQIQFVGTQKLHVDDEDGHKATFEIALTSGSN